MRPTEGVVASAFRQESPSGGGTPDKVGTVGTVPMVLGRWIITGSDFLMDGGTHCGTAYSLEVTEGPIYHLKTSVL
jgi:hypothetical protein